MDDRRKDYRAWDAQECGQERVSPREALPDDDLVFFLLDLVGKLEPVRGRRSLRVPAGGIDSRPGVFHRRQRIGSLRGLGLHQTPATNHLLGVCPSNAAPTRY